MRAALAIRGYADTGVRGTEMVKLFREMGSQPWFEPARVRKLSDKDLHGYMMFQKNIIEVMYQKFRWKPHKLAKAYGVPDKTMVFYLRRWKILRPGDVMSSPMVLRKNKDKITDWYLDDQLTITQIARKLGLAISDVSHSLKTWGIQAPKRLIGKSRFIQANKGEIIKYYTKDENPLPARVIGQKLNLSESAVMANLKKWGIPARSYQKAFTDDVVDLYERGFTPFEIAMKFGVDPTQIYKHLVAQGIRHIKARQFSQAELQTIRFLYKVRGVATLTIAKVLNEQIERRPISNRKKKLLMVTPTILYRVFKEQGWTKGNPTDVTNSELVKILGMVKDGFNATQISQQIKLPRNLVANIISEYAFVKFKNQSILREREATFVKQIQKLSKRGLSVHAMSAVIHLSPRLIGRLMKKHNIKASKRRDYPPQELGRYAAQIRKMRQIRGYTIDKIAHELDKSTSLVTRIIRDHDISFIGRATPYDKKSILRLHREGLYPSLIGHKVGAATSSVAAILRQAGLTPRPAPRGPRFTQTTVKAQRRYIKKFYSAPFYHSILELAKFLRVDKTTIKRRLQETGTKVRSNIEGKRLRKFKRPPLPATNLMFRKLTEREKIKPTRRRNQ